MATRRLYVHLAAVILNLSLPSAAPAGARTPVQIRVEHIAIPKLAGRLVAELPAGTTPEAFVADEAIKTLNDYLPMFEFTQAPVKGNYRMLFRFQCQEAPWPAGDVWMRIEFSGVPLAIDPTAYIKVLDRIDVEKNVVTVETFVKAPWKIRNILDDLFLKQEIQRLLSFVPIRTVAVPDQGSVPPGIITHLKYEEV